MKHGAGTGLPDGGQEIVRGWLKDRYGLCWQIVPAVFFEIIPDPAKAASPGWSRPTPANELGAVVL